MKVGVELSEIQNCLHTARGRASDSEANVKTMYSIHLQVLHKSQKKHLAKSTIPTSLEGFPNHLFRPNCKMVNL